MSEENEEHPQPPQPPEIERNLQTSRGQVIGVLLIMLLPVLALFGAFGESSRAVSAYSSQLEMRVEYPARFRYKMTESIRVSLLNTSAEPIPAVKVSFDRTYTEGFCNVVFIPDVKSVNDAAYIVELTDLQPKEMRIISVEIQADRYWRHRGNVTAAPAKGEGVSVSIETLVFP